MSGGVPGGMPRRSAGSTVDRRVAGSGPAQGVRSPRTCGGTTAITQSELAPVRRPLEALLRIG
jgi:hypothetical protein